MQWDWLLPLMGPSKEFTQMRYHLGQALGPQKMPTYRPLINNRTVHLISTLIDFEGNPAAKIEQ